MFRNFLFLFFIFPAFSFAQTLDYIWAVNGNQSGDYCRSRDITSDASGNSYLLIQYSEAVQFGTFTLANTGAQDIAVVKINSLGVVQWATAAGGTGNEDATAICIDNANSGIYVAGYYSDAASFGTQQVIADMPNAAEDRPEFFLAKINTSGQWQWARNQDGNANSVGVAVTTDNSGNVIVGGNFYDAALQVGSQTLPAQEVLPFIAKYTSAGGFLWLRGPSTPSGATLSGVACNTSGTVYIAGSFGTVEDESVSLTIGSIVLVNDGDTENGFTASDIFVLAISSSGDPMWGVNAGSLLYEAFANSIAIDPDNIIYVSGTFKNSFTAGAFHLATSGSNLEDIDVVVAALNPDGSWHSLSQAGNDQTNTAAILKTAPDGHIFIAGSLNGEDFDFDTFTVPYSSANTSYIARLNSDGSWRWGFSHPSVQAFVPLSNNSFRISGSYTGTLSLGTFTLSTTGGTSNDVYVTALDYSPENPEALKTVAISSDVRLYPLPAMLSQTIVSRNEIIQHVSCFDMSSKEVSVKAEISGNTALLHYPEGLAEGFYIIKVQTDKNILFLKTVKADL